MASKNYFKFLAASVMLLGTSVMAMGQELMREDYVPAYTPKFAAPAKLPTVVKDREWYGQQTYTWTDRYNATHTATLADVVTDPYQMYDMLKWVYTNPEIPGLKYSAKYGDVYYGRQVYNSSRYGMQITESGWGISDNVTPPYEEGYTMFLVKLKNYTTSPDRHTTTKANLVSSFTNTIESIEVIKDAIRVGEGDNAGTIINIEGEFNRFFIISKGKAHYFTPGYHESNAWTPPYAPFYNMFEEFSPTTTDNDAQITDFYDKMSDGEVYDVVHDCASVINFQHYFSMSGKNGTEEKSLSGMFLYIPDNRNEAGVREYAEGHRPEVGIYTINLNGNAVDNGDHTYTVNLDWTSELNEVVGSVVPQTYTLYVYVTDETGNSRQEIITTTDTHYDYVVPQDEHSYTITYVVYGYATENDAFHAWSNDKTVVIPGWNDFISLVLKHYESDFVKNQASNYYRNFMGVVNDVNAITITNINDGMNTILVKRYVDGANPDDAETVATITFTVGNNGRVNYSIQYTGQDILDGYSLNTLGIPTSGNLGNYGNDDIVDLSAIQIVDQFAASVEAENFVNMYHYYLALGENTSNDIDVPVYDIEATINGYYTQEQVDADTDLGNMLPVNVKSAQVEMNLINNDNVYYYTLDRGDDVLVPGDQISYLQRRQDGLFMEMNNAMGNAGNTRSEGTNYFLEDPAFYGTMGHYMTYQPVLWSRGERIKNDNSYNSYGSPVLTTGVGKVDVTASGTKSKNNTYYNWTDGEGNECGIYNPTVTITGTVPTGASVDYMPYMYRVWRICDDVRSFVYDVNTHRPVNVDVPEGENYKLIYEEMTNRGNITIGGNDELSFGATMDAKPSFRVRFYYVKDERATGKRNYYVVEQTVNWENISTSIAEFTGSSAEVSKTYVNAQGIKSDKPFDGLNIVITRYSDGSTKTTKVVR